MRSRVVLINLPKGGRLVIEYYHLPSEQTSCAAPYRGREGKLCSRRNTNRHTGIFRRSKSDCAGMEGLGSQLLPHLSRAGLYVIARAGRSSAVSNPHRLENCVTRLSVPAPRPSRVGNRWLPAHRGEGVAARGTRSSDRGARCRALLQDDADRASQGAHEDRRSVRYCFAAETTDDLGEGQAHRVWLFIPRCIPAL